MALDEPVLESDFDFESDVLDDFESDDFESDELELELDELSLFSELLFSRARLRVP